MLTEQQIQANKEKVIEILKTLSIEGADIEGLIKSLEDSDFFYAPASTKYHCAYPGGLCEHSLNVYETLCRLVREFASHVESHYVECDNEMSIGGEKVVLDYSEDTLKVLGLLHDVAKANFYERYLRNVKNDETGKWEQVAEYRVRDANDRFLAGSKGFNSFLIISKYIPLTQEEIVALNNQYAGMDKTENTEDLSSILNRFNLTVYLHIADVISSYCIERI